MKKSKIVAVTLTGTLAAAVLLTGTFAWQSISQRAKNEVRELGNPGGRLHDDFVFADGEGNKDVYVENFTSEDDGEAIYARIRLDEYMEIGMNAGTSGTNPNVTVVADDPNVQPKKNDVSTWTTYLWEREKKLEDNPSLTINKSDETSEFRKYVLWNQDGTNNVTNYMPTFNKNKDSKESELNGTIDGDGTTPYADYQTYLYDAANVADPAKTSIVTGFAVYDADADVVDELASLPTGVTLKGILAALTDTAGTDWNTTNLLTGGDSGGKLEKITVAGTDYPIEVTANTAGTAVESVAVNLDNTSDLEDYAIEIRKETHHAEQTLTGGSIISMEKWIDDGCVPGNYWVYDEDGWVYWANPIEPEEVTSLLLDKIEVRDDAEINGDYYYAIHVVAQFASSGDWGECTSVTTVTKDGTGNVTSITKGSGTGFYNADEGAITANGVKLLNTIADYNAYVITAGAVGGAKNVAKGTSIQLNVSSAVAYSESVLTYQWTVKAKDGTTTLASGTTVTPDGTNSAIATLAVDAAETADTLTISVTCQESNGQFGTGSFELRVTEPASTIIAEIRDSKNAINVETFDPTVSVPADNVIEIDGLRWWILYKDTSNTRALLFAEEVLRADANSPLKDSNNIMLIQFNPSSTLTDQTRWSSSNIRNYLNSTGNHNGNGFLERYPTVAEVADDSQPIYTRQKYNDATQYDETYDKVFLLSEADLKGTINGKTDNVTEKDYTLGTKTQLLKTYNQYTLESIVSGWYWLRNPSNGTTRVAGVGGLYFTATWSEWYHYGQGSVRPAFWVDLTTT